MLIFAKLKKRKFREKNIREIKKNCEIRTKILEFFRGNFLSLETILMLDCIYNLGKFLNFKVT